MLDIQYIRENTDDVKRSAKSKKVAVDIDKLLKLDEKRRVLIAASEELRAKRNELAQASAGKKPSEQVISQGKELRNKIDETEKELADINSTYNDLLEQVPNVIPSDTPEGGEHDNVQIRSWGEAKKSKHQDHLSWAETRGLLDFERGAKVAGAKFYYTFNELVLLEMAVFQLGMKIAIDSGFTPVTVPHMVNQKTALGTGFLPRGEEKQIYKIEDEDLNLIATAEIPITGLHTDEILDVKDQPLLYAGLSPAYRMEAGAYGKHSKGLYRVHQFNKLELYVFTTPDKSEQWHEKLVGIEEDLCKQLEIPYEVVRIAAGDLGAPAYKKYDINYWSPVDGEYKELMSCSNVTDFQARRLNIRFRNENGQTEFVHTLNGTAAAFSRIAVAIIENHQNKDGQVEIPKSLKPYYLGKGTKI